VRTTGRPHRHIELASYAWRLKGLFFTEAGWLDLHDGNLRFATPQKVVFEVPVAEVTQIVFPWYSFGGGVKLHAAGRAAVGDPAALSIVASKAEDIGAGRAVERRWRELLSAARAPQAPDKRREGV